MQENTIGYARIVARRGHRFPFRKEAYLDFTPFNGGFVTYTGAPGAIVLNLVTGVCADLLTGRVYLDARFAEGGDRA